MTVRRSNHPFPPLFNVIGSVRMSGVSQRAICVKRSAT
jgi:hypothetical protein